MRILFLDIETLPADERLKDDIRAGNLLSRSRRKELERTGQPRREEEVESDYRMTALSGDFGRLLCLAYAAEPPKDAPVQVLSGPEPDILREFWRLAKDADLFVGHNVLEFDLRFIMKRSIVHRVKPSRDLSFARFQSRPVFDTMREWEKWGSEFISLDKLARVLGLETSKKDLHGDEVYDAWRRGELDRIYTYCKADVELTRRIYRRMRFEDA